MIIYFRSNRANKRTYNSFAQEHYAPRDRISYLYNAYVALRTSYLLYHDPIESQAYYICVQGSDFKRVRYQKKDSTDKADLYYIISENEFIRHKVSCSEPEIQTILVHSL